MMTFEQHCANAETIAVEIEDLAKQLQRSAHAMKKAAHEGSPDKIRKAASQIDEAASKTRDIEATVNRAWPLSDAELTELLNGPYIDQLIDAARAAGVSLSRHDGCLVAFPVILRVLSDKIQLDTTQLTTLRPSVVIERIRTKMRKPPKHLGRFIGELYKAYQLVIGKNIKAYRLVVGENIERGTTLLKVYDALTLLRDTRKTYGKAEFTRDVYELDASDVKQTSSGATISFPAATGTKEAAQTLSIISPNGELISYYAIRFKEGL